MADNRFIATYRLQLTPDFGFDDAAAVLAYLRSLGVSHVYCSPYLQAAAGSNHGYDVIDHEVVNGELGGEGALARFHAALRDNDLGQVIDIVPNHMSIADPGNHRWWDVLANGRASDSAHFFDIDWDALDGRVLLAVLGDPYGEVVDRGEITIDAARGEVRYFDHRFPLAPGSLDGTGSVHEVLERQHYRLAHWRTAQHTLNYRRFFDVNTLIGVRVEDDDVFDVVHRRALQWVADGVVQGVRVDHPDGVRDPAGYLRRLRDAAPDAWIVIEKILEPGEALPPEWPVDGTTGYDAMQRITSLFVDPRSEVALTRADATFIGHSDDYPSYAHTVDESKQLVLRRVLAADVARLVDMSLRVIAADAHLRDFGRDDLRDAFEAVLRSMPVYRTYVTPGILSSEDAKVIASTIDHARCLVPHVDGRVLDWLGRVMRMDTLARSEIEIAARLQQLTGPAMAKGVEDTTFYRFTRLVALNEVGSDPSHFGATVGAFHTATTLAAQQHPMSMVSTTTHDTKRSEDVRARIALLSEMPQPWTELVLRWKARHADRWPDGLRDLHLEYLVYQTLVGAHPLPVERMHTYLDKAMREAKRATSWLDPDDRFERAAHAFVDTLDIDMTFQAELAELSGRIGPGARIAALSQLTLKLMLPGVPDIYQGSELWTDSLVDPDNRRPVDYERRRELLQQIREQEDPPTLNEDGSAKLWLTARLLNVRRDHSDSFLGPDATYEPLTATGQDADAVVAFGRGRDVVVVVPIRPLRLMTRGGWLDAAVDLPDGTWRNALDPASGDHRDRLELATLETTYHLAVLVRTSA